MEFHSYSARMNGHTNGNVPKKTSSTMKIVSTVKAHTNDVLSVQWSGSSLASGSADKSIRLWKAAGSNGHQVELKEPNFSPIKEHLGHVHCVTFSSFGTLLVTCGSDGRVIIWDANTGDQIAVAVFPSSNRSALRCCRVSHDSKLIAAAGDGDVIALWTFDKTSGNLTLQKVFSGHDATITSICFTHNSTLLLSASIGNDIRVWDCVNLSDQSLCVWRDAHDLGCSCMDLAPYKLQLSNDVSAYHVATGGYDNIIRVWHLVDRTQKTAVKLLPGGSQLLGHSSDICSLRFAHHAKLLVSCSSDRTLIVWDPVRSSMLHRVGPVSKYYIRSVCFSSEDRFVMAGFSGGMIGFWALAVTEDSAEQNGDLPSPTLTINRSLEDPALQLQFLEDLKIPDEFVCPITQEIMRDPHVAFGTTYGYYLRQEL
ncbi:hypothetical protein RvY_05379-2 [Ramazzottius varieornatus]|uniref:U-box domain-containing protein n=1 Tax=Ramazzottius varieornatus TaxID=947166 RepID=A0A1D1UXX1_RAMVA|nr:hypothetical protein RvY_05379-2 [Ramazzottius varieornatus]